jgi:hypothetical protein
MGCPKNGNKIGARSEQTIAGTQIMKLNLKWYHVAYLGIW